MLSRSARMVLSNHPNHLKTTMSAPHLGRPSNATRGLFAPACQLLSHCLLGSSPASCPHSTEAADMAAGVCQFNNPANGTTSPLSVPRAKTPNTEPVTRSVCWLLLQPAASRTETSPGLMRRKTSWKTTPSQSSRCSTTVTHCQSRRPRLVDCPLYTKSDRTISYDLSLHDF